MKRILFSAVLLVMAGVGLGASGCHGSHAAEGSNTPVSTDLGPVPKKVPRPEAVYEDAYEKAEREITPDNVEAALDALERAVAQDQSTQK